MKTTFYLVCLDTKERLWIGEGLDGAMTVFYAKDAPVMAQLQRFLNGHRDHVLRFVCADTAPYIFDVGWKAFDAPEHTR